MTKCLNYKNMLHIYFDAGDIHFIKLLRISHTLLSRWSVSKNIYLFVSYFRMLHDWYHKFLTCVIQMRIRRGHLDRNTFLKIALLLNQLMWIGLQPCENLKSSVQLSPSSKAFYTRPSVCEWMKSSESVRAPAVVLLWWLYLDCHVARHPQTQLKPHPLSN